MGSRMLQQGWEGLRDGLAAPDVQEGAAFAQEGAALVPATATHMTRPHTHFCHVALHANSYHGWMWAVGWAPGCSSAE